MQFTYLKKPLKTYLKNLLPEHKIHFSLTTNTTGPPHIITSKLVSLIILSLYKLRNYISLSNTPIPTFSLIDEKYKIKTKFKAFLNKNFPDYLKQGCELEAFLIEFEFEFTKNLQVRVRVPDL